MDLKTFRIEHNDLVFDANRNLVMIEGPEEETQSIERVLTADIREWFLHREHGLDHSFLQDPRFDEERARLEVVMAIHQDPRIESVESIRFDVIESEDGEKTMAVWFEAKMTGREGLLTGRVATEGAVVPVQDHVCSGGDMPDDLGHILDKVTHTIDLS